MNTWDANSFDWKALEEIYWWVKGHQAHHHGIWELPSGSDRHVLIAAGNILLGMAFLDTLPGSRNILNPMTLPREYFATFPSGGEAEADEFETQMKAQAAYPKEAAEVATDTASFYTIAPEQLATVFEDGKWTEHAKALWKDHKGDTMAHVRAMDKIIRQHGGAVFNTGADGVWEMKVFDIDDKPMAESSKGLHVEEKGMIKNKKAARRIALRYLEENEMRTSSRIALRYVRATAVDNLLRELDNLGALADNLDDVIGVFGEHFKLAATIDPEVVSQKQALEKATQGLRFAREVLNNLEKAIKLYPEDKAAQRALKDAGVMVKRFRKLHGDAHKMVSTLSKKTLPPALKKMAAAVGRGIKARMVDPSLLQVIPWQRKDFYYSTERRRSIEGVEYQVLFLVRYEVRNEDYGYDDEPKTRTTKRELLLAEHTARNDGPYVRGDTHPEPLIKSPKQAVDLFLEKVKGWKGIKGEETRNEKRAPIARDVARALQQALNSMRASDIERPTVSGDNRNIQGGYRSDLPKGGASDVGEYRYDEMVGEEISRFRKKLDPLLKSYRKHIKKVQFGDEEKSWIHAYIELK